MTLPSISARIEARIAELEALTLADTATPEQRAMFTARVDRLSVLVGALRSLSQARQSEANDAEGISPLDPRLIIVHLTGHAGPGATEDEIEDLYRKYEAVVARVMGSPAAPAPVAPPDTPGPAPAPTPPAPQPSPAPLLPDPLPPLEASPPAALTYSLAWYHAETTPERIRHGWRDMTLAGAQLHWQQHGLQQGRKWRPDAPAPHWGPREEDAPPGTKL